MATGRSQTYLLPYPQVDDSVNVHGDVAELVSTLDTTLQGLGLSYMKLDVKNVSGSTIPAATPVYVTGYNGKTTIAKSLSSTTQPVLGLTKTSIANNAEGICVVSGVLPQVNTSSFTAGDILYVAESGGLTNTRPTSGSFAIGVCAYSDAANGIIVIEARGNGTWGALKAGLS
jgi:hypothetical protein